MLPAVMFDFSNYIFAVNIIRMSGKMRVHTISIFGEKFEGQIRYEYHYLWHNMCVFGRRGSCTIVLQFLCWNYNKIDSTNIAKRTFPACTQKQEKKESWNTFRKVLFLSPLLNWGNFTTLFNFPILLLNILLYCLFIYRIPWHILYLPPQLPPEQQPKDFLQVL